MGSVTVERVVQVQAKCDCGEVTAYCPESSNLRHAADGLRAAGWRIVRRRRGDTEVECPACVTKAEDAKDHRKECRKTALADLRKAKAKYQAEIAALAKTEV